MEFQKQTYGESTTPSWQTTPATPNQPGTVIGGMMNFNQAGGQAQMENSTQAPSWNGGSGVNTGQTPTSNGQQSEKQWTDTSNYTPQQAAAAGLGWVDKNNPNYGKPGFIGQANPNASGSNTGTPIATAPSWDPNRSGTGLGVATGDANTVNGTPTAAPGANNPSVPDVKPPDTTPTTPPTSQVPTDSSGNTIKPDPQTAPDIATPPTVTNTRTADTQALIDQLTKRANQGTVVDPNDPVIKAQTDAFNAQEQRANKNYAADQAEKNSPYATGANENVQRMMAEKTGQDTGQFQGQLMQNELNNRRTEIQNALSQLGSTLSDEQKNNLQAELANLNAALTHSQQSVQNQQFYSSLNQNDKQFVNQLTQNERFKNMDDALSRYTLAQQQGQFVASLAQQADFKKLDDQFRKDQLSTQDSEFLKQLAQNGQFQQMQQEYLRLKMSSDQNNFLAQLAQNGQIAQMDDIFKKMQLAQQGVEFGAGLGQNESQFLDQMGMNQSQFQNFWDALQRGQQ